MVKQEKSIWKGGLLGDEMGMGKTIQAVSLIMSDWPAKEPSLVVVPPVALMQWQAEINDYTSGKLKVLIYHISANPKCKLLTVKDLKKYDVIMVSYSGLESMYRKQNKGWSRNDGLIKEDSILHAIKFHRLILDEAHSIKSRTTGVAKACFALKSNYKWCLSGTPVQNRIGEFFSLLRFLEVMPFACYFCKSCKCRQLHWSQDKQKMCTGCKHSGFNHVSVFNQEILNPITQAEDPDLRKKGLEKLRFITDRIMLRRMKRDHTSSMELPPKDVIVHNEFFGEIERDFSQSIMSNSTRKFDTYVNQGVMLNNYANIFGLIMQMRQVANHPDLILRRNGEGGQNILVCCICDEPAEEAIRSKCHHEFCRQCAKSYVQSFAGGGGDADCPRCHIPLQIDWEQPEIEQDEENVKKSSIINRIKMEDWTSSTKIEMLVYDLYKLRSKKQTHKSIVFSQFTSMLQLVQWRLQKSGFSTVLLDGSMSPAQRQKSIDHFMNNVDCEVFLVSLKAGGVALNLTEASRVYIVDP
jgi:DNA repair protein RAD16